MTNLELIRKWKELKIKFKSSKESKSMLSMFIVCVGETEIDVEGKKERVIGFYQGFDEKGSPAALFSSDDRNRCWTYALDSTKNTHIKSNIGKFIK